MPDVTLPTKHLRYGVATVTTTAAPLTAPTGENLYQGLLLQAHPSNESAVWIGHKGVKASGDAEGFPIGKGSSVVIPCSSPSDLYIVTDSLVPLRLYWLCV